MGQPVKLSDSLVLDARLAGKESERSISGQIEFWSALGRALEGLLRTPELIALRRAGLVRPLSACLNEPGTKDGDRRVASVLAARPFPHFEAAPDRQGLLVRIDEDGTRTVGRFVQRVFEAVEDAPRPARRKRSAA